MKKKKRTRFFLGLVSLSIGIISHCLLAMTNTVTKNYGISFGINGWFFVLLSFVLILLLTIFWWRNNFYGVNLVIIGGWINLIDRIAFGYVRDYWRFGLVYNNIADWIIQIGVIIFLLEIWIKKSK